MLDINLTSSLSRSTSGYSSPNSISSDGKKIFIVYEINASKSNTLAAELFDNMDGRLMTNKTLHCDLESNFIYVDGGKASPCFKKFSILDDNGQNTARLRIVDCKFNVLSMIQLKDYYAPGFSFNGGSFSEDGKYVAVTYVKNPNYGYDYQKSILRIFRTDNLEERWCYEYDGNTGVETRFFNLDKKMYIILSSLGGQYNAGNQFPKPPALLKILKLKENSIKLVHELEMPSLFDYDISKKSSTEGRLSHKSLLILVGTNRANIKNQIIAQNKSIPSFLNNDGDEYRIYKFKNKKLKLVYSHNYDTSIRIKAHNKLTLIQQSCGSENLGFTELIETNKYKSIDNGEIKAVLLSLNNQISNFSSNGEWMIITGSRTEVMSPSPDQLKNVLLYNISQK